MKWMHSQSTGSSTTPGNLLPKSFVDQHTLRGLWMFWISVWIVLGCIAGYLMARRMIQCRVAVDHQRHAEFRVAPILKRNEVLSKMLAKQARDVQQLNQVEKFEPNDDALQTIAAIAITSGRTAKQANAYQAPTGIPREQPPIQIESVEVALSESPSSASERSPVNGQRSSDPPPEPRVQIVGQLDIEMIHAGLLDLWITALERTDRLDAVATSTDRTGRGRSGRTTRSQNNQTRMVTLSATPLLSERTP